MKKLSNRWLPLFTILIFSVLGMKALATSNLFTAHDIWHQIVRFYYYNQAVNDGQWPPYWIGQLANGFGYPLFFFSYHFPWIIGTALLRLGFNIPTAINTLFFLSYFGSGLTMYIFITNLIKNRLAAVLSAILYLWLPYHFLIILVSASMGIAFVFTFLPLVLLGIYLLKEKRRVGILVLSVGLSGITLSHIMHLIFLFPIILFFLIWGFLNSKEKIIFLKNMCFGLLLWILISSFYLIPAIYYNNFTRVHQETGFYELYKRNFINFNQLLYSKWGYSPIVNNAKNGEVSFQLGIAQWISIITLAFLMIFKKLSKSSQNLSIYLLLGFATSVFLMLDFSKIIWAFLVKFATLDFPFRLLLSATFIASVCAGIVLVNIPRKLQIFFFIILISVVLYTNRNHLNVNQYTNFPISTYLSLETEITTNTFNEYLPIGANPVILQKPWNEIKGENISVSNLKSTTNQLSFDIDTQKEGTASAGQFNFPGQAFYLDNQINQIKTDEEGRISFTIPQGKHTIMIKYQETLLIKVSKYLTLVGLLLILLFSLREILLFKRKA